MPANRLFQRAMIALPLAFAVGLAAIVHRPAAAPAVDKAAIGLYGKLPLGFEASDGQFVARGSGYNIVLKENETVLRLQVPDAKSQFEKTFNATDDAVNPRNAIRAPRSTEVRIRLARANPAARSEALDPLPGRIHSFLGNDPRSWRTGVTAFARVRYASVYPGIDLVYYGNQRQLEYDFIVAPGADPRAIELRFEGADGFRVDDDGDLVISTGAGEIHQYKPEIFQEVEGGRKTIEGQYTIRNQSVGFQVGDHDPSRPLVIDPVLAYSTFFGSGGGEDVPASLVVDAAGQIYLTGTTAAGDFPTVNPVQGNLKGKSDVFVSKLNAAGNALVYSTYLGGRNEGQGADLSFGIAIDATGNAYVTGATSSTDFPVVAALQSSLKGPVDAFVTKLNSNGAIGFSTYLGGSGAELGCGIAVDSLNAPYIVGTTSSTDLFGGVKALTEQGELPLAEADAIAGPDQTGLRGSSDAFVIKLIPSGGARTYGRYIGGGGPELGLAVTVDPAGSAYVTGLTSSNDFPTVNPLQPNYGGGETDGFVTKIAVNGGSLAYSTYLGGSQNENYTFLQKIPFPGVAIAVDNASNAYVAGTTSSSNFPTRNAVQPSFGGEADAYVTKINAAGNALVYSTFLGGSGEDLGLGLAVDRAGNAYVTGATPSTNFPLANPLQSSVKGEGDAFITKLNAAGNALVYSTFLGGGSLDLASSIAVDTAGNAYVFGLTTSGDYPTAQPLQASLRGEVDTFIARLRDEGGQSIGTLASVSAANYLGPQLAPESISAAFGNDLATRIEVANSLPLPTNLAGTTVVVKDSLGMERPAPLFFVAPKQINFQIPPGTMTGQATISVTSGAGGVARGTIAIASTAPGLFSADASGQGLAAAVALRLRANGEQVFEPVARFDQTLNRMVAVPIDFGPESDQIFLILFGTGMRFRTNATASVGGTNGAVLYVGPSSFVGLDQCNVNLPRSLAGRGDVNVAMTVDGQPANMVHVRIR